MTSKSTHTSIVSTDAEYKCLHNYVHELERNAHCNTIISNLVKKQNIVTDFTVYRGQSDRDLEIYANKWFSTTSSHQIALSEFAGDKGVVFTIHVMGMHALNVNAVLNNTQKNTHNKYNNEDEYIIDGDGGVFYNSPQLTQEGYSKIGARAFETWYSLPKQKNTTQVKSTSNEMSPELEVAYILENIDKDEYEFIDSIDDMKMFIGVPVSNESMEIAFQQIVSTKGGYKMRKRKRKSTRKHKRTHNKHKSTRKRKCNHKHKCTRKCKCLCKNVKTRTCKHK
jgi:hypothetical protein